MPHRGSMEFWHHRRAQKPLPRMRNWAELKEPEITSVLAFKAGMTHVSMVDDSQSPTKGQEITRAATLVAVPKTFVYGIRLYKKKYLYRQPAYEVYDKNMASKLGIKETKNTSVEEARKHVAECEAVGLLAYADASSLGMGNKKLVRFEIRLGGRDAQSGFAFAEKLIGSELKAKDIIKPGDFVDVISISKGKGWEGPVKRFGVARQYHKATGKIRHVGTLGPWHPPKVMFGVPMAGHLGFNYRTELNKRVLKIGSEQDAGEVMPAGGILHYGVLRNEYLLLDGSLPGAPKRLVRIRKAIRHAGKVQVPNILYVSRLSKQGA